MATKRLRVSGAKEIGTAVNGDGGTATEEDGRRGDV